MDGAPLAYVFVHGPRPGVQPGEYLHGLGAFHAALAAEPPAGFVGSWVWQRRPGEATFEDWYLVEDWAALGALNDAAVSGTRARPHDTVAPLAGWGAGGIYALRHGRPVRAGRCDRARAAKPPGVPYPDFEAALRTVAGPAGAVWQRQMVLGPDPEYLLDLPGGAPTAVLGRSLDVAELRLAVPMDASGAAP